MSADVYCTPEGAVSNLTFALHPTGLRIADSQYIGCIVGAAILIGGATVLSFIALGCVTAVSPAKDGVICREGIQSSWLRHVPVIKNSEAVDIAGLVRHPNNILVVGLFIYQGAALSALRLAASGSELSHGNRIVGGTAAAVLLGITAWLHRRLGFGLRAKVHRDTPGIPKVRARVRPWDDPKPPLWIQRIFVSELGDWVSCRRENHWINRWQCGVRHFKQNTAHWGLAVEILSMWFLALAQAWSTPTFAACGHVRLMAALVHVCQLLLYGWKRPYRCHRDNVFQIIRLALMAAALLSLAVGFYSNAEEGAQSAAESATVFMNAAIVAVLAKVATHLISELILFIKGWRATSQLREWEENSAGAAGKEKRSPQSSGVCAGSDAEEPLISPTEECPASPPVAPVESAANELGAGMLAASHPLRSTMRTGTSPYGRGSGRLSRSVRPRLTKVDSVAKWRVGSSASDTPGGLIDLVGGSSTRSPQLPAVSSAANASALGLSGTFTHLIGPSRESTGQQSVRSPSTMRTRRAKHAATPTPVSEQHSPEELWASASSAGRAGQRLRSVRKSSVLAERARPAVRSPPTPPPAAGAESAVLRKQFAQAADDAVQSRFATPVTV